MIKPTRPNNMLRDHLLKSPEELEKEKEEQAQRQAELEKEKDKRREEIDRHIEEIDEKEGVTFALEHLKEPDKIAEHVNRNSESYSDTFSKLITLYLYLECRANLADDKAKMAEETNGLYVPCVPPLASRLSRAGLSTDESFYTPHSKEGNELRELVSKLKLSADYYYNHRKELGDDDPDATPLNLFTIRRVRKFLPQLADEKAQLAYLLRLKDSFLQQDERGQIRSNGLRKFHADGDFQLRLENLINTYREITAVQGETQNEGKIKLNKGGTQYQQLLAIHYLLLNSRANCHNTKKARFASFLTGYSEESFRQQWSNIHRKADESGPIWERDMQTVRGYFEALGLPEIVNLIDNDLASEREKL